MAPGIRALTCPNCGARLRWNGHVTVVECRYCQTHVAVDSGGRTDRPTEAVSVKVPRRTVAILVAVSGLAFVGVGAVAVINRPPRGSTATTAAVTSTVAEILATPLAATAAQIAARHHVAVLGQGSTVLVKVADKAIEEVQFSWDAAHPDHVRGIVVRPRAGADSDAMIARAQAQVGRRLRTTSRGTAQFLGLGASMNFSKAMLHIQTNKFDDPAWRARFVAMWSVLRHAALGDPKTLDEATRRDVLDLGYPLDVLAKLPFDVEVTAAAAAVHQVAPNAESNGVNHRISIDHPWFEYAALSWDNKEGGGWRNVVLYFPVELKLPDLADKVIACLAPVAGEPNKLVTDHLAGTFSLQYRAVGGKPWIDVGATVFQMYPHYAFGDPVTAAGFAEVVTALAGCGK